MTEQRQGKSPRGRRPPPRHGEAVGERPTGGDPAGLSSGRISFGHPDVSPYSDLTNAKTRLLSGAKHVTSINKVAYAKQNAQECARIGKNAQESGRTRKNAQECARMRKNAQEVGRGEEASARPERPGRGKAARSERGNGPRRRCGGRGPATASAEPGAEQRGRKRMRTACEPEAAGRGCRAFFARSARGVVQVLFGRSSPVVKKRCITCGRKFFLATKPRRLRTLGRVDK